MFVKATAIAGALAVIAVPAFARMTAPDAQTHFKAIASGRVSDIMSQYSPNATFVWIGGPLDGSYKGTKAIRAVWKKFARASGKMMEKADDIVIGMNPKGMTVTANVEFSGKKTIPVRYVLAYRNGKIVDEVWQIAPNAKMR